MGKCGWQDNEYIYCKGMLKRIARSYASIYEGIEGITSEITEPFSIVEYKADFDRALDSIGRGHWDGNVEDKTFKDFRRFGRSQQAVIADIYGIKDDELEEMGFYNINRLKGYAYYLMTVDLN